jgi:hypothetical protein
MDGTVATTTFSSGPKPNDDILKANRYRTVNAEPRSMKSTARLSLETNAAFARRTTRCVGRLDPVPHKGIDMCDRRT